MAKNKSIKVLQITDSHLFAKNQEMFGVKCNENFLRVIEKIKQHAKPFVFILDDIIAEIYGYKITRTVILSGFAVQTLFALACQLIVLAPYPASFKEASAYTYILGPTLLRIDISGFVAYIIANLVNTYVLTRWKVLLQGRRFWLRSLGSSAFSEALYSLIAIIMIEINSIATKNLFKLVAASFLIKLIFSLIFAAPAQFFVNHIKRWIGIDVYDFPNKLTSFKYFSTPKKVEDD